MWSPVSPRKNKHAVNGGEHWRHLVNMSESNIIKVPCSLKKVRGHLATKNSITMCANNCCCDRRLLSAGADDTHIHTSQYFLGQLSCCGSHLRLHAADTVQTHLSDTHRPLQQCPPSNWTLISIQQLHGNRCRIINSTFHTQQIKPTQSRECDASTCCPLEAAPVYSSLSVSSFDEFPSAACRACTCSASDTTSPSPWDLSATQQQPCFLNNTQTT